MERRKRQSVSETRQKPPLEKNCSSGLVRGVSESPLPLISACNLKVELTGKVVRTALNTREPHLCPLLLPQSTAPPHHCRTSAFPFPGAISALLFLAQTEVYSIQKGSVLHQIIWTQQGPPGPPMTAPISKALLSLSALLVAVQGKLGPICAPPPPNTCAPQQLQLFWVAKISRAKQEEQLCSQIRNGSETSNTDSLSHTAGNLLLHLLKPLIASQKPISPAAPHLRGLGVVAGATVSPFDEKKTSHYHICSNRLLALT